jgi:glutathione S-transferase
MTITLLGSPVSPFVRKVHVFLLEKGLDFEVEPVSPFAPPDGFRELSPLGKIPALRDDDRVLNDSSVICRYLEHQHGTPALYPRDAFDSARAEWIEEYIDGGFVPKVGPGIFFPLVIGPMNGEEPDEEAAQQFIDNELPEFLDYLESQLGSSEFFVGETLTIADISVASVFVNLRLAGVRPEAARWPYLNAFLARMHARESFVQVIEPARAMLGKLWVELD